ncbi:MAG: hypothetical protein KC800_19650 [Candidatus Eremiobacteraeota bacterium]|nr:hypothetical protein [Candidatus Eremiobacteraeota bacterium]
MVALAEQAGAMIQKEFYRADGPRGFGEKAPIDTEIEAYLRAELGLITPNWSILGEEMPFQKGSDSAYCWVLDPQDGTSAFLRGFRGSSVSIGLTHRHQPVLGVVHAPLYPNDGGDLIYGARDVGLFHNGKELHLGLPAGPPGPEDIVAVSQDADRRIDYNLGTLKPARYLPMPSIAYRLALAAAGEVRAGMSLAPLRALDVAAGHALLSLTDRELHHLSTPENPSISYRDEQRLHGVIGGDPVCIQSLTPWRWDSYFGPKQNTPLCRPSHGRKVSGPALSRAQGCLLGQLAGELSSPPGRPTADGELALSLARTLLVDGEFRPAHLRASDSEWLRSQHRDDPLGELYRCSPLGVAFTPEQLAASLPSGTSTPTEECVRLFVLAISQAVEGNKPESVAARILETASPPVRTLLESGQDPEAPQFLAFRNALVHLRSGTALREAVENSRPNRGPAVVGALLGAFQGYESIPAEWRRAVLTCRQRSRPIAYWPVDALTLAEHLLCLRKKV